MKWVSVYFFEVPFLQIRNLSHNIKAEKVRGQSQHLNPGSLVVEP